MLISPKPIQIPEGLSQQTVIDAIQSGMTKRDWQPKRKSPNEIIAILMVRGGKHIVSELITIDKKTITFSYYDSVNMDYGMGIPDSDEEEWSDRPASDKPVPMIHRKYNSWVANLRNDIKARIRIAEMTH